MTRGDVAQQPDEPDASRKAGRHLAADTPAWGRTVLECLRDHEIENIVYLPDSVTGTLIALAERDRFFRLTAVCREEEAVGVLTGLYLGAQRGVMSIQSAGLGNSLNALGSLAIAYRIPFPMIITLRGELGEFNPAHVAMGRAVRGCLDALGIHHLTIRRADEVEVLMAGALKTCFTAEQPFAILLSAQLTGWKSEG
jgi:sulfopyruvate decarboxylase alpha subunit